MPRSSRHKSHKQSKHSSRDYSDSEEDVVKMKEKSSKDDSSSRGHRDLASGEKRKISSHVREGKDSKDLSGRGNGDVLEEYVLSKRRKEKADVVIGGDRWNAGGDERGVSERHVEKEMHKGESLKVDTILKENSSKGENLRTESKIKSKRYDSGTAGERKEDNVASAVVEKEESKSKGESKRKSERDSSLRKEVKDLKDKDRRSDKEKNVGHESKIGDAEMKLVDMDVAKKQGTQLVDLSGEKQGKRSREINESTSLDELRNLELDKDMDKKVRRKGEGFTEQAKLYDEPKESDGRRSSSKGDRAKDLKYRDDKHKDGGYADKSQEDVHKDDRRRDEKYRGEADKDNKHPDDKYGEDGERDARHRGDRHREDGDRDSRRKDEKYHNDGERDSRRKDDKYHEGVEREGRRDDKYHDDGDRDRRRKDDRTHEDGYKDIRRGDERYYDDGDRDDRRRGNSYRDDGDRDYRYKEEKYREDNERDIWYKDSKQGDGFDREKRQRDTKFRDERTTRDRAGDKSDNKRSRDDGYAADYHVRKSIAYDVSPTHDDQTVSYRDDQGRRKKDDYGDIKFRSSKDQRSDAEKKSASSARIDPVTDRVRPTSRNIDIELISSHGRRRTSPTSYPHAPRDNYRSAKQEESKYRDYNYDERPRHGMNSTRDYAGPIGGSEKTPSSRSLDKLGQKDDVHFGDLSAERRLKSDTRSSPLQLVDKSSSSSTDRRQFTRPDIRRNVNVDESIQRSGASRDWKEYSAKDVNPAEEPVQTDADTVSVSSPFVRNSHFSSNSKSLPLPPLPFRTNVDSPALLGSGDDDGRGKANMRHRRIGEPNIGRMQGNNAWRGVPSWPSPVANGFLRFPHASPFHSVMQPFPAPSMFSVRPSMELNHHPSPYHMTDADRFSGPGRPMGWRNQVDDPCLPLHQWDESHMFGRSDWDHSRIMSGARGWETSADSWKGPNRTASMEVPSSEKENNNLSRSGDGVLAGQSVQPPQNEQSQVDHQEDSTTDVMQLTTSFEKDEIGAALVSSEDSGGDVAKVFRKDDMPLCAVYLSKLDISLKLAEPELFDKCTGLIDTDKIMCSDIDDSKILYMEDVEVKMASPGIPSLTLFASIDDLVFKKSMSLYKRQKENFYAEYSEKPKVLSEFVSNSSQEDKNVQEELWPIDSMQGVEEKTETLQEKIDQPAGKSMTENSEEPISALDLRKYDNEDTHLPEQSVKGSNAALGHVKDVSMGSPSKNEDMKLVDTKYDPLLNSDMSSDASEAVMPESFSLSRIHHSPESTH